MLGITLAILIGLLALAIPVAAGLGFLGLALSGIYSKLPLSLAMGEIAWGTSNNFLLVAIPFFVLLGEILLRSGMAERMYNALVLWVPWLPGGLMHSNIAACAMFAATSGSSVATAATIGTVALGEVEKRGYSERLFLGTIAAGGTLGILIPPSINMIVYGVLTDTSIPKLYLAGFIPGLVLASLFSLTVIVICLIKPSMGGTPTPTSWPQRIAALPDLLPPLIIFLAVIGSIYAGWATATESAALGVIAAVGIAAANRRLSLRTLLNAFEAPSPPPPPPAPPPPPPPPLRRPDAHHRHDHGDPARGLLPQFRHYLDRADRPGQQVHHQPRPQQARAAGRGRDLLLHPRHVHGDAVD